MRFLHILSIAGALSLALVAPAAAQQTASPDLQTTAALLQAGGGSDAFSGKTLMMFLAGTRSQYESEIASLDDKFGAPNVTSFLDVFTFVFTDSLKQLQSSGPVALPSPNTDMVSDPESLAEVFYKSGVTEDGFSVAALLEKLFGHDVHATVVKAVSAKYGDKANQNFEAVLMQSMSDMKSAYDL
jgi:hypothetical protein